MKKHYVWAATFLDVNGGIHFDHYILPSFTAASEFACLTSQDNSWICTSLQCVREL